MSRVRPLSLYLFGLPAGVSTDAFEPVRTTMIEITGDIWDCLEGGIIVITTNGQLTANGRAVFGRGVARQAGERFPDLALRLGRHLAAGGNHVHYLGDSIVSFPVEDTPWSLPDLRLIARSTRELRELADLNGWQRVVVPRPGCGGGGLDWRDVRPLLATELDDRFMIISSTVLPSP